MSLALAKMYGILIASLAAAGLLVNGHLFDIINTDFALDVLRIGLAFYLIYAAFLSGQQRMVNNALMLVGILYVGMGILGIVSSTLGGLLPSGLTGFDIAFHLLSGIVAILAGMRHGAHYVAG
jgi:hypothetical protein